MNISYSFGMADLMHFGHIRMLRKAAENADLCIFGLVSDAASDAWFGAHVSNEAERKSVLESIKYIDEVWPQTTFDPLENLRMIHSKYPKAIISLYTGNDWGILSAKKYVESIGGKVEKLEYYEKLSPQAILDTLNRNEVNYKRPNNNLISTKANTLQSLKDVITKAKIEDVFIVTVGEYFRNDDIIVEKIIHYFKNGDIVIRSSSKREDAFEESNAGHFTSVLNVDVFDREGVKSAISTVIASYGEDIDNDEQVLIQRQTNNVLTSGVVFTRDIQRNRPYYVINYDESGSTDAVTSGAGGSSVWLSHTIDKDSIPAKWKGLMDAVWEIEDILSGILLDIEFAVTPDCVVIFQVRPLAAAYKFGRQNNDEDVEQLRKEAIEKYRKRKSIGLSCFSDMAFWNPAEIIGDNPKNLDFSLYREIITKSAWDRGLVPMGYRQVPKELMFRYGNKPYISVDRSFEALIPAAISDDLAKKLCTYYLGVLEKDLSAHDKIEFEISHNCYDFSLHNRLAELMKESFSTEEILTIEKALTDLTIKNIVSYKDVLKKDNDDLKKLEGVRLDVQNVTNESEDFRLLAKSIHNLLDAINTLGTPQFSRQARCAFIAKSLCKSLVTEGYISSEQYNNFLSSIRTIAVNYDIDYHAVLDGNMSKDLFIYTYGHLRAGTYNIRSPRYDQMDNLFSEVRHAGRMDAKYHDYQGNYDKDIKDAIQNALSNASIEDVSSSIIVEFVKAATEQREYFKFIFSKSLSFAIELIKQMGRIVGVEVSDLSYLELPEIYAAEYYSDVDRLREFWQLIIGKRREIYRVNSDLILPSVICSEKDFAYIGLIDARPNYITESVITGDVVAIDDLDEAIDGKIVVIEKADPGYDWIFSKGIIGLVTKYGGAASHMAIRCAEFMIPAAIGSGSKLYEYAISSKKITIDCKHEKLIRVE